MSAATAVFDGGFNWFKTGITAGLLLVGTMLLGLAYLAAPGFREWLTATLGVGWAIALGFGLAVSLAAVYRPGWLFTGWRWWSALTIVAVTAVAGLSLWQGDSGPSYTYGMAGQWGYALTGGQTWVVALEVVVALVVISLLVVRRA